MATRGVGRKERLSASSLEKLNEVELSASETVALVFEEGPLGLQILDVPRKGVMVWHLSGQAAALGDGVLRVGARVEAVAGVSCADKDLEEVFELVKKNPRPLEIEFRLPVSSRPSTPGDLATSIPPSPSSMSSTSSSSTATTPSFKAKASAASGTPPGQTQVRLQPIDRSVSSRLRNFQESETRGKEQDGPADRGPPGPAPSQRRKNDTVCVVFRDGPLGLQISDVGKRVLVTQFENNPDGSMGQAEKSGLVHFGFQVVKVGPSDCEGMSMHQIGMLVQKQKRPVAITFRKLYERRDPADDPARARRRQRRASKAAAALGPDAAAARAAPGASTPGAAATPAGSGQAPGDDAKGGSNPNDSEAPGPAAEQGAEQGVEEAPSASTPEDEEAEEAAEQGVMAECECGNVSLEENALSNTDPMYFHFVMLCKSSQIQILLDHEATLSEAEDPSKHPAFELSSLHMPTLYKRVNAEEVQFPDWPTWIRLQYLDAYISQSQGGDGRAGEKDEQLSPEEAAVAAAEVIEDPTAPGSNTAQNKDQDSKQAEHDERLVPPSELCTYCKAKRALRQRANTLNDDMYIHFALLFRTVKIQAENSTRNQEGYVEYLSSVDVEDLYRWCQKDGISMHEWMQWIKKQCAISYEEYLYKIALSGDVEIDLRDMIKESVPA